MRLLICVCSTLSVLSAASSQSALRRRQLQADGVVGFQLVDAVTDAVIADIVDGGVIFVDDLPNGPSQLNVQAMTSPYPLASGKIQFTTTNSAYAPLEGKAPYAYCRDNGGDFRACNTKKLPLDTVVSITATPTDASLVAATISFTISTEGTSIPSPTTVAPTPSPTVTQSNAEPTLEPSLTPTVSPTTVAPTSPTPASCNLPQFIGDWESAPKLPYNVQESQGAFIGTDFLMVSGFFFGIHQSTEKVSFLNTGESNPTWTAVDDFPIHEGVSHGGYVVVGSEFYMCGGYLGGHPGPAIDDCFVYDHSVAPGSNNQWSTLPSLPAKRAGGALLYQSLKNSLLFTAGAVRPDPDKAHAVDHNDTWELDLNNLNAGWVSKAPIPYFGNHISFVTAYDHNGDEHHYVMGGQEGEKEKSTNRKKMYEWVSSSESWVRRQDMTLSRGHASSSTTPYGCGLLIIAGTSNGMGKIGDISYYDIPTDTWTSIGHLGNNVNTPCCSTVRRGTEDSLYCFSPSGLAKRRKISVPS